jgi:hypothetical protein
MTTHCVINLTSSDQLLRNQSLRDQSDFVRSILRINHCVINPKDKIGTIDREAIDSKN